MSKGRIKGIPAQRTSVTGGEVQVSRGAAWSRSPVTTTPRGTDRLDGSGHRSAAVEFCVAPPAVRVSHHPGHVRMTDRILVLDRGVQRGRTGSSAAWPPIP
ncbi:hypothetical protein NKH18_46185 [Streptomyces sp. M10(2022)]